MFNIDLKSKKSIYEQIINGFKHMIVSGELQKNEKLPSVRDLAEILTVNPNTIQKAFREMESQGWIYSVSGRGNFVSEEIPVRDDKDIKKIYEDIGQLINELKYYGLSSEKIISDLKAMSDEKGGEKND